jgi:hypothetical protein
VVKIRNDDFGSKTLKQRERNTQNTKARSRQERSYSILDMQKTRRKKYKTDAKKKSIIVLNRNCTK